MKPRTLPGTVAWMISLNLFGAVFASAQLTWDADGAAGTNPSDGGGAWLDTDRWWDGASNTTWNNVTHANTQAIFGTGGTSGIVTFGTGVSAGGLQFNPVASGNGYLLGGGTLTLAPNAVIDIRDGASNSGATSRVRFSSTSVLAGSDITISNAVQGTSFASYATLSGNNTWTGTLTATGNATGLFTDVTTPNALNTLTAINIGATATLALNQSATAYTTPTIRIGGDGLGGRGSLRFDNGTVTLNSNIELTTNGRISTNASGIGVINGVISGTGMTLTVNSGTDAVNRIVLKNTNTFGQLTVGRGNVQIGEGGVGTSGLGVTNLNGSVATPAIISGTGTVRGLFVSGGSINPGDNGGLAIGTLQINGNLNFTGVSTAQTVANFTLGAGGISDRINVSGDLRLDGDGNLAVLFGSGYTPTLGDSWTLIDWDGTLIQNEFSLGENLRTGADADGNEGNLNLDDLTASGYRWNVGTDTGALVVSIVPEPSVAMLSVLAVAGFAGRRRRSL